MAVSIDAEGRLAYVTNDALVGGGNVNPLIGPPVTDGKWHQVVTTWDDTSREMNLYLDGQLVASQIGIYEMVTVNDARDTSFHYGNTGNNLLGTVGNLLLGNGTQLRGEIAYAAAWERVLTPSEVAWHWDARNN